MKPRFYFDPAEAVAHLRGSDEVLAGAMERVGAFSLKLSPIKSLFEAMLRSIVYQQLHGKAAAAIHGRVLVELKQRRTPYCWRPTRLCAARGCRRTSSLRCARWPRSAARAWCRR